MADDGTLKDNPPTPKDLKKDIIDAITSASGDNGTSSVSEPPAPSVSKTPGDSSTTDLKQMVVEAEAPYAQCSVHETEMMEKNIACITCQKLVCALCLRDFHLKHEIMSVIKLRELKQLGGSLEKDLSQVQCVQLKLNKQIAEREDMLQKIDESKNSLITSIEQTFSQLHDILITKEKEVTEYIFQFYLNSRSPIQNELDLLTQRYKDANAMIKRVLSFFNKLHIMLKESPDLPAKLKQMSGTLDGLPTIENEEQLLVDCKFDKILPSLHAIANICSSIHPEATKICWSRVTPNKMPAEEDRKKSPGKETTQESPREQANKDSTKETAKVTPEMTPTRVSARNLAKKATLSQNVPQESTEQWKKNNGKLDIVYKKGEFLCHNHKAAAMKRKMDETDSNMKKLKTGNISNNGRPKETSVGTNTNIATNTNIVIKKSTPNDFNKKVDDKDSSVTKPVNPVHIKQEFQFLKFNPAHLEPGYAAIVFVNNKALQIGKVISTSKVKTDSVFEILWYKGDIGKDKIFSLKGDDKPNGQFNTMCLLETSMVSVDNLICFFQYDFRNTVSDVLNEEINRAIC